MTKKIGAINTARSIRRETLLEVVALSERRKQQFRSLGDGYEGEVAAFHAFKLELERLVKDGGRDGKKTQKGESFEEVLGLWDTYQNNMRPETRNDFIRAFKTYRDNLVEELWEEV